MGKSEGLRSRTWLEHTARPPLPLRQGGEEDNVLVVVGCADLDSRRTEMQTFLRKALKASEKVRD